VYYLFSEVYLKEFETLYFRKLLLCFMYERERKEITALKIVNKNKLFLDLYVIFIWDL